MESLIKSTRDQNFSALITVVISDNELAPGIGLANKYNVHVEARDDGAPEGAGSDHTGSKFWPSIDNMIIAE